MIFQNIYPTKIQRIEEQRNKIIENPRTKEEAGKNREVNRRIEKIKEVF